MRSALAIIFTIIIAISCSNKSTSTQDPSNSWKKYNDTEDSIKKYLDENKNKLDPIEGIYSVSASDEKTVRYLFGLWTDHAHAGEANDFARVAIMKQNTGFSAQFIEIIVSGDNLPKYAKVGEFTRVQESQAYLSRLFSPSGKVVNYSFFYDSQSGLLIGRSKKGDQTWGMLSYLKLYPVKD